MYITVSEHALRVFYMYVVAGDHVSVINPHLTCLMAVLNSERSLSIKCYFPAQAMLKSGFFTDAACKRMHLYSMGSDSRYTVQQHNTDYSRKSVWGLT